MNEQDARAYVNRLRRFYTDAFIYAIVNLGLILIWAISGGGYFWPIWVIIGWGIGLGVHAFYLGLIPQVNAFVPFMTKDWEEKEVRRLMKGKSKEKETIAKMATKVEKKVEEILKPVIKKVKAPKKKTVKKAPKKAPKKVSKKKA